MEVAGTKSKHAHKCYLRKYNSSATFGKSLGSFDSSYGERKLVQAQESFAVVGTCNIPCLM